MTQEYHDEDAVAQSHFSRLRSSKPYAGFVVFGAAFTDGFLYGIVVPVLPFSLVDRSGVNPDKIQFWNSLLLIVFGGSMIVSCAVLACITSHLNSRRAPLLAGLISAFSATILFMVGSHTSMLIVGRCLQGLSSGVVYTAGLALISETVPQEEAGSWIGFALSGFDIGILVAPFLAGLVYEKVGYYQVFAMGSAVIIIELLLVLIMRIPLATEGIDPDDLAALTACADATSRETAPSGPAARMRNTSPHLATQFDETSLLLRRYKPGDNSENSILGRSPAILLLLRSPQFGTAVYGCFLSYILATSFDATMPLFVSQTFSWTSSAAGATFLALSLPSILAPAVGALSDRYGPRVVTMSGFFVTAPGLACMALTTSNTLNAKIIFWISLVVVGLGYNLFLIPLAADMCVSVETIDKQHPQPGGAGALFVQAYAFLGCALALGTMLGPFLSGILYEWLGWAAMCAILAGVVITATIPVMVYTHGRKQIDEDQESL